MTFASRTVVFATLAADRREAAWRPRRYRRAFPAAVAGLLVVGVMRAIPLISFVLFLAGCASPTRSDLKQVSAASDPSSLTLGRGYNDYVRRAILADGTEAGIITCRDGSSSRFWFRSHHLTDDDGGTLFRFSDGAELFMSGGFCCEVQLPEQQLASSGDLRAFIQLHDGVRP